MTNNPVSGPSAEPLAEALIEKANKKSAFKRQTSWYDGTVLMEIGDEIIWLKIYNGKVIDSRDNVPPIGYDFKISGTIEKWEAFFSGDRKFGDLLRAGGEYYSPEITIEGNLMEANRMHETIHLLAKYTQEVVNNG